MRARSYVFFISLTCESVWHLCVFMFVCVCTWRQRVTLGAFLNISTLPFVTISFIILKLIEFVRLAGVSSESLLPLPPHCWVYRLASPCLALYVRAGNPTQGLILEQQAFYPRVTSLVLHLCSLLWVNKGFSWFWLIFGLMSQLKDLIVDQFNHIPD